MSLRVDSNSKVKATRCAPQVSEVKKYITYTFNDITAYPSRFGDQLISFVRAFYLAYAQKLPLVCKKFKEFDKLKISDMLGQTIGGVKLLAENQTTERTKQVLKHQDDIKGFFETDADSFEIPYGPYDSPFDHLTFTNRNGENFPIVDIDPHNLEIISCLKELIAPKGPIEEIEVTQDISIALHFRGGSGKDTDETKNEYPCKFSKREDCIDILKQITLENEDKSIYCHLFTDLQEEDKLKLLVEFKQQFPSITFDTTRGASLLKDFFGMAQHWTYFSRADSQFGAMAELLSQPLFSRKQRLKQHQYYLEKFNEKNSSLPQNVQKV